MKRLLRLILVAGSLFGAGYLFQQGTFDSIISSLSSGDSSPWQSLPGSKSAPARNGETIRIASFNIQVFGTAKMKKTEVVQILAEVIRRFDIVAIQEIRSVDNNVLPQFLEYINATGRRYDFAIGPRLGRTSSKEQYAYIFDTDRIEMDRHAMYTVDDPDDLLHREPLVGSFRVRGPKPSEAFTFTLVNIHTDPDEVRQEMNVLDDVFRAVLNDGRGEDDIIMLGDFNTHDQALGELGQISSLMCALSQVPTNTRGTKMYDNIIFDRYATREFEGRSGVLDLQAEFNLTLEQALEVSDHLPIWAEFSIYEGGRVAPLASRPGSAQ